MMLRSTLAALVVAVLALACDKPPAPAPPPTSTTIGEKIKSSHDSLGSPNQLGKAPEGMPSPHVGGHGAAPSKSVIQGLAADAVLLKVNDHVFKKADLDRTMTQSAALAGIPPDMLNGEMREAFETPGYEKLIERALLGDEAKRRGMWPTPEEAKAARQEMLKTLPQGKTFDDVLKTIGTDEKTFDEDIAADVAIGKLLKALEAEMPAPPSELVDKLYEQNKKVFVIPDTASAQHILVKADRAAGPDVLKEKEQLAKDIKALLVKEGGKDAKVFAKIAAEKTEDGATRGRGGDLGTFKRGDLFPELDAVVFKLKEGEIAGPVLTDRGFHVVRGGGVEKGRTVPEKEAKAVITDREKVKAFMAKIDTFTADLRKAGKIERIVEPLPSPLVDPNDGGSKVPTWRPSSKNATPGMMNPHGG